MTDSLTDSQTGSREARRTGRPGPCLAAGAVMLGVPTLLELIADPPRSAEQADVGLVVTVVLAIGALAVVLTVMRPQTGAMPTLSVVCTALALFLVPPEAIGDGVCGFACLAFLLAVRLHRESLAGQVDLDEWINTQRPMVLGAAVTTPAAIAAAAVPAEWSLLFAALVGVGAAVLCALTLLN